MAPLPSSLASRFRADLEALAGPANRLLGIALSGGPDSLALLLLAAAAYPGRVRAATVDHGLRPESRAEAELAARACMRLGVPHRILPVTMAQQASVQAAAREARYAALSGWAAAEKVEILLTAHHADDQAETLMMRLLRGSGVGGLAGIRARVRLQPGLLLCRPLLMWRRSELAEIVAAAGIEAATDPSNCDEAYDRVRIRNALAAAPWIDAAALARSAAALADAEEALGSVAETLWSERGEVSGGIVSLSPGGIPDELLRRLVLRALREVLPGAAPRGDQLTALIVLLRAGGASTLAGVKCSGGAPKWRFEAAPERRRTR
jgi:tRNA(Ile)-lysidine synthase